MDNLYTFGKEKYVEADELKRSDLRTIINIIKLVATAVKCTILGIFIIIKSLVWSNLPFTAKDIQYQVALVRYSVFSISI